MGRPLFSTQLRTAATGSPQPPSPPPPPSAAPPVCEKWTPWNAFDPDADEFFTRDDAVFEAFVPLGDADTSDAPDEAPAPDATPSPMAVGADDPAHLLAEIYARAPTLEARPRRAPAPASATTAVAPPLPRRPRAASAASAAVLEYPLGLRLAPDATVPAPRLFAWATSRAPSSLPAAPGPLTSAGARMALAHIAPTRMRVRDIVM